MLSSFRTLAWHLLVRSRNSMSIPLRALRACGHLNNEPSRAERSLRIRVRRPRKVLTASAVATAPLTASTQFAHHSARLRSLSFDHVRLPSLSAFMDHAPLVLVAFTLLLEPAQRSEKLRPTIVAYDCEPRRSDGHVDQEAIVASTRAAGIGGYDYLVWHRSTDWLDLLPLLRMTDSLGLQAWVTLPPPSEQAPPHTATPPYGWDFVAWQDALGLLASEHWSLRGLVIDDFDLNPAFFTARVLDNMSAVRESRGGRPPAWGIVYRATVDSLASWWATRSRYLQGIIYAYEEYDQVDSLGPELRRARAALPPNAGLGVNIYVTGGPGARTHARTVEYLRRALTVSDTLADLVRLYCLPLSDQHDSLYQTVADFTASRRGSRH
jgi:hypothetical protein